MSIFDECLPVRATALAEHAVQQIIKAFNRFPKICISITVAWLLLFI